jgi:hypothetical protein
MPTTSPAPVRTFSRQYCGECLAVHWVEEVTRSRFVCHGVYFTPKDTETHYTRWRHGTIEMVEKAHSAPDVVTDWMFVEVEHENPEEIQDW